jgi:hypothetical protein
MSSKDFCLVIKLEICLRGNANDAWAPSPFWDDLHFGKRGCGRANLDLTGAPSYSFNAGRGKKREKECAMSLRLSRFVMLDERVHHWHHKQSDEGGKQKSTDYGKCQRLLQFGTGTKS